MKLATLTVALGLVTSGLAARTSTAYAQAADAPSAPSRDADAHAVDAPSVAGSDDMPWNRGVSAETRARARAVFLEGNRLFKIPLFSPAVEKYREAIAAWPHPAFYFNLALAQINLAQNLDARDSLQRAIEHGAEPLREDRYAEAKKQLVEVEKRLGRIRVRCDVAGVEVSLDGARVMTGPGERVVWTVPAAHDLVGKAPAYRTQDAHVNVRAGAIETVTLAPRKLIEDRPWAVWKPWAVVGAGVAIAAAGGALHALSRREFARYDDGFAQLECAPRGCTEAQIRDPALGQGGSGALGDRLGRARTEQGIAVGSYVAGGLAIAVGAYLAYRNQPHVIEQDEPRGVALAPMIAPELLGVAVTVRR